MSFVPKRSLLQPMRLGQVFATLLVVVMQVWLGVSGGLAAPASQGEDPQAQAEALLETLTPEERVGQLFLVTFNGVSAAAETQIYDLIANYHIGGVVLRRDMDNFAAAPDTVSSLAQLVSELQQAEDASAQSEQVDVLSGETHTPVYIPLLIAISEEGDGYPTDQILQGLSPQPSAMTIGATWDPELARQAGELLGAELSQLGVNMLLGPSLDVLEDPRPQSLGDLGVRSFGGDPFWVGQMGQAYITGLHQGSDNALAVIAKHLPGNSGTDRPVEEEVPTVRKSLSQLSQIELPPFFSVTGEAPSQEATTDGMLIAHIRYQGFQGNIRSTTRPISLDSQAFDQLMALPQFASWRANGGLIVSDSLGTRAIRRNYDSTEQQFNSPFVARDAFLAGNDLLYLGNFRATGDVDAAASIQNTVAFFAQKYREDQAFAERVDQSVTRILALKFKLYPTFSLGRALPASEETISAIGDNQNLIFEVGRRAATLLSPAQEEITGLLPEPPGRFEQVVFLTDSYTVTQCSQCPEQSSYGATSLADAALALYGPRGGNQISAANLTSFSFAQLARTLDNTWPAGEDPVADNLQLAEWVVFGYMHPDGRAESDALRRLLSERPDLIQNKKVIVFAFNAPYYLDATDITRVTAYYGLYTKEDGAAELAARLLFQELIPLGVSPVSIEGLGYSLLEAVSPDVAQTIPLSVQLMLAAEEATPTATLTGAATVEPATPPVLQAGDLLSIEAGPIVDYNGHIVPDNTPVNFAIAINGEGGTINRQIGAVTRQGIAMASYSIEVEGSMQVYASAGEPPARSDTLQMDVIGINPEGLALQATQTAQAQLMATASAAPPPTLPSEESAEVAPPRTGLIEWFLTTLISLIMAVFAFQTGSKTTNPRWAVRWGLTAFIGGLLVGSYLAFNLPGSQGALEYGGQWAVVLLAIGGAALGWLGGWIWKVATPQNNKRETSRPLKR